MADALTPDAIRSVLKRCEHKPANDCYATKHFIAARLRRRAPPCAAARPPPGAASRAAT
eukprot:gene39879-17629_t